VTQRLNKSPTREKPKRKKMWKGSRESAEKVEKLPSRKVIKARRKKGIHPSEGREEKLLKNQRTIPKPNLDEGKEQIRRRPAEN